MPAHTPVRPLLPGVRWLLLIAAGLVLLAGFQLFVFTGQTDTHFAWTIANPLAAAFLGAGYWASVGIEALAARQPVWANARIAVPTVFVFTVLTLVATLLHLDKFHLGGSVPAGTRAVTWAWIAIYVLVPLLMLVVVARQARTPGVDPPRAVLLPGWVYAALAGQAVILFGFGVALFAAPGATAPLWPWQLTPLLAQATGAWLISLGVAAGHALLERDARRLRPAAVGSVLLAVLQSIALARYPDQFHWDSAAGVSYLIVLAAILVTGAAGLAGGRRTTPPGAARRVAPPAGQRARTRLSCRSGTPQRRRPRRRRKPGPPTPRPPHPGPGTPPPPPPDQATGAAGHHRPAGPARHTPWEAAR